MSYQVRLRRAAQKQLDRLAEYDYEMVAEAISALEQEPCPPAVRKLTTTSLWRLRVRDFRIVYSVDDRERVVNILRIARRSEDTYKRL